MRMFFIDLENINASGLEYVKTITQGDRYYVFYSDACSDISEETIMRIRDNGGSIKLYKVENGTGNALDFQLSSFVGYVIRESVHKNDEYIIVSGDKGYDVVCRFWRKQGYHIQRINRFTDKGKTITALELKPYLDKGTAPYEAEILYVLNNVGNTQRLYANLGKIIRNANRTGILYHRIKPLFLSRFKDNAEADPS